jgi:phage-related minor tail protein
MEVITIENQAFSQLLTNLDNLTREIRSQNSSNKKNDDQQLPKIKLSLGDQWLDNEDVCKVLRVTKRTLQNYRDNFVLPYSQIGKKILYKASDVQLILEKNYITLNSP